MRIFADTEFNGFKGELLSLGLISETGDALYVVKEMSKEFKYDPWVAEHVVPILHSSPHKAVMAGTAGAMSWELFKYLDGFGVSDVTIVVDWPDDIKYISELLITGPGKMIDIDGIKFELKRCEPYADCRIPATVRHNAMWDAIVLRDYVMKSESSTAT